MTAEELRTSIRRSLTTQGFRVTDSKILPPSDLDKDAIRRLHTTAVRHRLEQAKPAIFSIENRMLQRIANGHEVSVQGFDPEIREVKSGSDDELLFRYVSLHWAIPVSSGYGRRLRFLVVDRSNNKLVGIFGLCDPVISLAGRDGWIGWTKEQRFKNLRHVMDAFVLGAVPPYSHLLCGKLIALLALSKTVREAFRKKYAQTNCRISGRPFDGRLALITTMSALGRSSVYNRLKVLERLSYRSVGFSQGTGEFHFSNGLYSSIAAYATRYCTPTYRSEEWGRGFRNRREVIRKCLRKIHLNIAWSHHGISREIFVAPLANNVGEFLRGEHSRLQWFEYDTSSLVDWFRERWFLSRAARDASFMAFRRDQYRLWPEDLR